MNRTMTEAEVDIDFAVSGNWTPEMEGRMTWLRENEPVYWSEKTGHWIISTFDLVSYVSKHNEIFCSGEGVRPNLPIKLGLIDEDEPRHGQLRGLINKGFTPRMVTKLQENFKVIVDETIDAIAKEGRCDFVRDIAVPMPLLLIAEMIGIRREDRERFHQWSDAMIAGDGNFDKPEIVAAAGQAFAEYTTYVREILEDRRINPQDDLASILVGADTDGVLEKEVEHRTGELPEAAQLAEGDVAIDELVMFMVLLMVAGNETTRNGLSGGMQCLIDNPEARQRLIDDPSLIPQAVEEMLRWTTPVRTFARTAVEDAELGDKKIRKGEKVLMLYSSANHDAREFDSPEVFDIDRNPNHLAFGLGNHFCLGANLARMEMRVALEELLKRLPDMEYTTHGPEFQPSALVRTCGRMLVSYTPEA
jgi:cytochrome P450 family 142 subfamily A polypeptide 1